MRILDDQLIQDCFYSDSLFIEHNGWSMIEPYTWCKLYLTNVLIVGIPKIKQNFVFPRLDSRIKEANILIRRLGLWSKTHVNIEFHTSNTIVRKPPIPKRITLPKELLTVEFDQLMNEQISRGELISPYQLKLYKVM